jgi:AraC family ethanolamine operon transcriptional activator
VLLKEVGMDSKKSLSLQAVRIESSEDLRECTRGSDIEIVQLKAGKRQGSLTHLGIGNLAMTLGRFTLEVRARGVIHPDRVTIGMLLTSPGRVSHWGLDVQPGDLCIYPPGVDHDGIYGSGVTYAAVSMAPSELVSVLGCEGLLADPEFLSRRGVQLANPLIGEEIRRRLAGIIRNLERNTVAASTQAVDFLRRSIIEAFVTSFINALPPDRAPRFYTGARLVREVENYVDAAGGRPVHISELCSALRVSRRSLHRAFADTLNMGPVGYLRRRRLSAIQVILKRNSAIPIANIAFEHGFSEPGRFAAYYRSLFGEMPSETRRSAGLFADS